MSMIKPFFTVLFFCLWLLPGHAQEYSYARYDSKDGLAGSTVYCMTQDKDGFIWFGTESGLTRFDGTHFKNFTREDGLPDNEVIQVFADSKGRVWIAPFRKSICYYYKGRIYNQDNDAALKRIQINKCVLRFAEDAEGNILMQEVKQLHLMKVNGEVSTIQKINGDSVKYVTCISRSATGGFCIMERDRIFKYHNNRFSLLKTVSLLGMHFNMVAISPNQLVYRKNIDHLIALSLVTGKEVQFPLQKGGVHYKIIDDTTFMFCSRVGAVMFNLNNVDTPLRFLPGVSVTNAMKDSEGNIWICTVGHGVYRLHSAALMNIKIAKKNGELQPVYCLEKYHQSILVGSDINLMYRLYAATGMPDQEHIANFNRGIDPVFAIRTYGKDIIVGTGFMIVRMKPDYTWKKILSYISLKAMCPFQNKMLVACSGNVFILDLETFEKNFIWNDRATTVHALNDTAYFGTLYGLYSYLPGQKAKFEGEKVPLLRNRISAIDHDAGNVLWIGTYDEGLIGYKNGQVVAHLTSKTGLSSNICRTVFCNGNTVWVGTDKGLNEIEFTGNRYSIKKFTTTEGLASDVINAVYIDGNKVFAGSPEGVTVFDEQKMNLTSRCDLVFTDFAVAGVTLYPAQLPATIPHAKNNLRFSYVGISYKSAGDIRYRYRLLGLDSNWKETRETFLSYPTLPSGDYELQVQAINKFEVHSKIISTRFMIEKLMWEKTWFHILVALIFLTGTASLVWLIVSRIRRREEEKTAVNKRIGELEQLARKAQMNPHFIFNSLNSIQQYVMDADIAGANKFISGFSRLIRQTLDFSSKAEITLEEELNYLSNYLDLERTRLENAFSWSVQVDGNVNPEDHYIPPMILQPFVENSVRHGLRYRKDNEGKVIICVKKTDNHLICILEDNGIGRKAAMKYKSISPIEYQSKGLSLTSERIAMLNKNSEHEISMQIVDLEDNLHNGLGTIVTIRFPIL
jgi:ligand-binding sensor domain-containing protein